MKICAPQLGISPTSNLGGAVYDRELLKGLAALGVRVEIPLPQGEDYAPTDGWQIYPTAHCWRYTYEYNWLFLQRVVKLWRQPGFDLQHCKQREAPHHAYRHSLF